MNVDISKLRLSKEAGPAPARRRRSWRRYALIVLVVLGLVLAAMLVVPWRAEVKTVAVTRLYPYQGMTLLNASGYVVAQRKAAVASKVTAQLEWLGVEEGSRVAKDQVIARLESGDRQALLRKAEADRDAAVHSQEDAQAELADATLNFKRMSELLARKVVAKSEFDTAEARIRKARAQVERTTAAIASAKSQVADAQAELGYTQIRAPFDAVVLTKSADVGDIVTPLAATANAKASVVTIADLGSLMVEVDVSESNIEKVKNGGPCIVTLDAMAEERFPATVHMIVPTADRTKATILVKVKFDKRDPRILPEMSAKVAFLERPLASGEAAAMTAVPQAAVTERDGKPAVFEVQGDKARLAVVTLGPRYGDMASLASGPAPGNQVVLSPPPGLKDGDAVRLGGK